jgi:hypothetical protein
MIFGLTISEMVTIAGLLITIFSGILYINIKLSKLETSVNNMIAREIEKDKLVIETARLLKEVTTETATSLRETTLETARILSLTLDKKDDKLKSIEDKIDKILFELIAKFGK